MHSFCLFFGALSPDKRAAGRKPRQQPEKLFLCSNLSCMLAVNFGLSFRDGVAVSNHFRKSCLSLSSLHCIMHDFLTAPRNCRPPPIPCSLAPRNFFLVGDRSSKAALLLSLCVDLKVHLENIEDDMGEMKRRLCQEFNFCRHLQSICVHVQPCCLKKLLALGRCRL